MKELTEKKLKVEEAKKSDVGRQIARIHTSTADQLGLKTGDVIEIKGKSKTYVRVWRNKPPIVEENTIRIEAGIRRNAEAKLDEYVAISKVKVNLGKKVTIKLFDSQTQQKDIIELIKISLNDKILSNNLIWTINAGLGKTINFKVLEAFPEEPIIFTSSTEIIISDDQIGSEKLVHLEKELDDVSYEDIGGLDTVIKKLREMVELPLRFPEIFERVGIQPPKGVLLFGPPGTGKTILAKAVAGETQSTFISIGGPEIMSKYYGEAEGKLREIFENAKTKAPSIIFIDEIDSIASNRNDENSSVENRIVAQLLTLMDGIETRHNVVVIAATNRPNSIDTALRRGGRFDREIEIGMPDLKARLEILNIQTRGMPLNDTVILEEIAKRTQGFVGADINVLVKEAALHSIQRVIPELEKNEFTVVNIEDFDLALTEVSPSALREVIVEIPNITWEKVGGLQEIKEQLIESLEWPTMYNEYYDMLKIKPEKGILLYGPPGTGKTMLAKAVANEINMNFISIKGPELISKWVGETEKAIREIFRKARSAAPCIIFFDEIDSIASTRSISNESNELVKRIVSQLLTEIDGVEDTKGVVVLAATNRPDLLDNALIRPGRFDRLIFVGNPNFATRKSIFSVNLENVSVDESIDLDQLAQITDGLSGAELVQIIQKAKLKTLKSYLKKGDKSTKNIKLSQNKILDIIQNEFSKPKHEYTYKPPSISDMNDINIA